MLTVNINVAHNAKNVAFYQENSTINPEKHGVAFMDLDEYLFRKRISQTDFAKHLGISRNHLGEILRCKRSPSVKLAKKIGELTQGEVTKEEAMFPKGRE
jgi:DNA-binding XRE family transcriptional regulator